LSGSNQIEALRRWLSEDYPNDAEVLLPLCLTDSGRHPLYFDHPGFVWEAVGLEGLPRVVFNDMQCGYVYLSAYYFCVDSVLDGHPRSSSKQHDINGAALHLGHLLAGSIFRFEKAFETSFSDVASYFKGEIRRVLAENARAILAEIQFRSEPFKPNTDAEFDSIVGRSNSFILLFELAARMAREPLSSEVQRAIRSFVFYMQLADDLGDWREDYRAERWTSFLRECVSELGRIPSESELEQHVYLGGAYERRLQKVIKGFDKVLLEISSSSRLKEFALYVLAQRAVADEGLKTFTGVKLEHGLKYESNSEL
jgi:hypothetical protein